MTVAKKFLRLHVWNGEPATGAEHMAADEALLRLARDPVLRWYRWARQEISFGYPLRWRDVESSTMGRPAVRRWTGGGIVEHGDDLTIAIAVPATHSQDAPAAFYERVHRAIAEALDSPSVRLAAPIAGAGGATCFENPVRHDVLAGNQKVAGGAIRRCREGTLYQGSIQNAEIPADFIAQLARNLAVETSEWTPPPEFSVLAENLRTNRYATNEWLEKR
ncbi:MAG: lipoyl protein ligase domain-containing protein [Chthoniobacterales bacterium]